MSKDSIEIFQGSTIQHGKSNDRIYLMKLSSDISPSFPIDLINLAKAKNYTKIFAKIPENKASIFIDAGFQEEARIPAFYSGKETSLFMGLYMSSKRKEEANSSNMEEVLKIAISKAKTSTCKLKEGFTYKKCTEADAKVMAKIYKEVFPSYPFPIDDPAYIIETMKDGSFDYFGIEVNGQLIALSSAEKDKVYANAEMSDFATLPNYRGSGLAQFLLCEMEKEMKKQGIKTTFTIARAISVGMNVTFSRGNYQFGGRLKNNTNISGNIESMNIWYKNICD